MSRIGTYRDATIGGRFGAEVIPSNDRRLARGFIADPLAAGGLLLNRPRGAFFPGIE